MATMVPFQRIEGATLNTTVEQLREMLDDSQEGFFLALEDMPESLMTTRLGDLFYIGEPVHALTSRQYLDSADSGYRLARLFQEEGDFFPYNPEGLQTIRPDE